MLYLRAELESLLLESHLNMARDYAAAAEFVVDVKMHSVADPAAGGHF